MAGTTPQSGKTRTSNSAKASSPKASSNSAKASSRKASSTSAKASSRKGAGAKKPARTKTASARSGSSRTARSASTSRASSNGAKRNTTTGTKRSTTTRSTARRATPATASSNGSGGVADTVKHVATKAAGPAVAVGAAAAGIAGGIVLKSRMRRKTTVLGVTLPRSIGKGLPDLDAKSIAKSVGHASKQFAKTTKNVSKDLERAGDQAERIGKILD